MSDPHLVALEAELRTESKDWTEGYLVRLYHDSRKGLEAQADEAAILAHHGYLTQSSELAREGSLMVAYVLADQADEYTSLEHPGLEAATDPGSLFGRFARPLAWLAAIAVILFAAWLLVENLAGA
ncbi:MAG: hypothetical protein AB1Z67_12925 [Candidatus Limnocylindrales bacterium]